jgi:hypothetical protein
MSAREARQELLASITPSQAMVVRLMVSILAKAWGTFKGTLTPRQKELLARIGKDENVSTMISDVEEFVER